MKNILIYPHDPYIDGSGGITVHFYLAKILDEYGQMVRMYPNHGTADNDLFNKYYNNDFPIDNNCIVIYCEGIQGNPLGAPLVVRWLLSELGKNVPYERFKTWGKNDIVYFFNGEKKISDNSEKVGSLYKFLSTIYLNPKIDIYNITFPRKGICYTERKCFWHKNGCKILHPPDADNISFGNQTHTIDTLNQYEIFISYDPCTFITVMAPLCGCISVVHPVDGVSESEWLKSTAVYKYSISKNINKLYGIAYGLENFEWARNTLHLAKKQWEDIVLFNKNNCVLPFIIDINNFESMENTVNNLGF